MGIPEPCLQPAVAAHLAGAVAYWKAVGVGLEVAWELLVSLVHPAVASVAQVLLAGPERQTLGSDEIYVGDQVAALSFWSTSALHSNRIDLRTRYLNNSEKCASMRILENSDF